MGLIKQLQAANRDDSPTLDEQDAGLSPHPEAAEPPKNHAGVGPVNGKLIEHGEAPYNFEAGNKANHYALIEKPDGTQAYVWGVDLPRALNAGEVEQGDYIELRNLGRQEVTIAVPIKDRDGIVLGEEPQIVHRNAWAATKAPEPSNELDVAAAPAVPEDPTAAPTGAAKIATPPKAAATASKPNQPEQPGTPVQQDLLTKILNAPFALTAAAGSAIVSGIMYTAGKAHGFYVKGREDGHHILGQQLDEAASNIVKMTDSLKDRGMDKLIGEMKATGRPLREVFDGMKPGGAYQHLGERFNSLMKDESFAETYAKLERAIGDFGYTASNYAKTGVELDLDYADTIEQNVDKISAATEGFIGKGKDGALKHLQEMARAIGDRINAMLNNLFRRLRPQ
jgi:hypothetical protein